VKPSHRHNSITTWVVTPTRKYAAKTRGRPFKPGNPGKPPGARHKTTLAVESLLEGEAEKLTRKVIRLALAGDTTALRLCLERIAPVRRGRPVRIALPDVKTAGGVADALATVVTAMGDGTLAQSGAEATILTSLTRSWKMIASLIRPTDMSRYEKGRRSKAIRPPQLAASQPTLLSAAP
jgi:hypothetical protein